MRDFVQGYAMIRLLAAMVLLLLAGCGVHEERAAINAKLEADLPVGTVKLEIPGVYEVYIAPIKLADGTRCVTVIKRSQGGAGIDCEFP
jgi:hypothetical protein